MPRAPLLEVAAQNGGQGLGASSSLFFVVHAEQMMLEMLINQLMGEAGQGAPNETVRNFVPDAFFTPLGSGL